MDAKDLNRLQLLQQRIDRAMHDPMVTTDTSHFSEYAAIGAAQLETDLMNAAMVGGIKGVEALLDRAEALAKDEDNARLRYAIAVVLTHLPTIAELGLRLPSLDERAGWKILPSRQ